jgi:hypothetical protein
MDENMKTKFSIEIRKEILLSSDGLCIGPFSPRMIFCSIRAKKRGQKGGRNKEKPDIGLSC